MPASLSSIVPDKYAVIIDSSPSEIVSGVTDINSKELTSPDVF